MIVFVLCYDWMCEEVVVLFVLLFNELLYCVYSVYCEYYDFNVV